MIWIYTKKCKHIYVFVFIYGHYKTTLCSCVGIYIHNMHIFLLRLVYTSLPISWCVYNVQLPLAAGYLAASASRRCFSAVKRSSCFSKACIWARESVPWVSRDKGGAEGIWLALETCAEVAHGVGFAAAAAEAVANRDGVWLCSNGDVEEGRHGGGHVLLSVGFPETASCLYFASSGRTGGLALGPLKWNVSANWDGLIAGSVRQPPYRETATERRTTTA